MADAQIRAKSISGLHPRAEVLTSPAVTTLLSVVRDKASSQAAYVNAADRLTNLLAEEGLARLSRPMRVATPCGECDGLALPESSTLCVVDIMRSGGILVEAVRRLCPNCRTAKILIQRDEKTAMPQLFYAKLPEGVADMPFVVLCDPMLATGGSALMAIQALKDAGVKEERIIFLNVVSCPEGIQALATSAPGVRILTAALDERLNEDKYIVPGLGDFGDRYYGTCAAPAAGSSSEPPLRSRL